MPATISSTSSSDSSFSLGFSTTALVDLDFTIVAVPDEIAADAGLLPNFKHSPITGIKFKKSYV